MPLDNEQKKALCDQIVANPYFQEVVELLEKEAVDEIANSKTEDDLLRLELKIKINVIRDFKHELTKHTQKDK